MATSVFLSFSTFSGSIFISISIFSFSFNVFALFSSWIAMPHCLFLRPSPICGPHLLLCFPFSPFATSPLDARAHYGAPCSAYNAPATVLHPASLLLSYAAPRRTAPLRYDSPPHMHVRRRNVDDPRKDHYRANGHLDVLFRPLSANMGRSAFV